MVRSRGWLVVALSLAIAGMAAPATPAAAAFDAGSRLPAHLFTPYFEAYTTDSPWQLSDEFGAQIPDAGLPADACARLLHDHVERRSRNSGRVVHVLGADIARIRAAGGDVIPSFGGYSADHDVRDRRQPRPVPAIAAAYEYVITTYNVTRLDLDTEDNSLTNNAGIDRRNRAIAMVEEWAVHVHRLVQFVYTVPTNVAGLDPTGVHVLQNAVLHHARIDIVNIMSFDYYDNLPDEMANDTRTAAGHLLGTLHDLYPNRSSVALWHMIGITEMIGIDDFGPS